MTRSLGADRLRRLASAWPLAAFGFIAFVLPLSTTPQHDVDGSAFEAGMRVAIDPETGDLVPMPADGLAREFSMDRALSRSSAGLVEEIQPDGSVRVNLQGRFQSASVVRLVDGELQKTCTHDAAHAAEFMDGACDHDHAPATAPVKWEVK